MKQRDLNELKIKRNELLHNVNQMLRNSKWITDNKEVTKLISQLMILELQLLDIDTMIELEYNQKKVG